MGESLVVIPVRIPLSVLQRLQQDAAWVAPFEEDGKGKSTVARVLMMHAYNEIDKGTLPWGLEAVKGVRSNSGTEQSAPRIPPKPWNLAEAERALVRPKGGKR